MEFFNQLPSNPWAWLLGIVLTGGGFILAYRSTPQKVIKCRISSNALITKKQSVLSKLAILYDGKNIDNLTVSTVTFWNNSFPTINATDIIDAAPLSILVKGGEILDVSVIRGHNTPNCIDAVRQDDNTVKVLFDYIDKKEGGIIQVVHTGGEKSINVSRKIKGGKIVVAQKPIVYPYVLLASASGIFSSTITRLSFIFPQSYYIVKEVSILKTKFFLLLIIIVVLGAINISVLFIKWQMRREFVPQNCKDN